MDCVLDRLYGCGPSVILSVVIGGLVDMLLFFFFILFGCGSCDEYDRSMRIGIKIKCQGKTRLGLALLTYVEWGMFCFFGYGNLKGNVGKRGGFGRVRGWLKETKNDGIQSILRSEQRNRQLTLWICWWLPAPSLSRGSSQGASIQLH